MTPAEIEEGPNVFVDPNIFVYHFVGASSGMYIPTDLRS